MSDMGGRSPVIPYCEQCPHCSRGAATRQALAEDAAYQRGWDAAMASLRSETTSGVRSTMTARDTVCVHCRQTFLAFALHPRICPQCGTAQPGEKLPAPPTESAVPNHKEPTA